MDPPQSTSSFAKGGLRRIFGGCHVITTENLPQSLFRKEGSALLRTLESTVARTSTNSSIGAVFQAFSPGKARQCWSLVVSCYAAVKSSRFPSPASCAWTQQCRTVTFALRLAAIDVSNIRDTPKTFPVVPAKAGIQRRSTRVTGVEACLNAFAGTTERGRRAVVKSGNVSNRAMEQTTLPLSASIVHTFNPNF